ncbi:MAG TPA: hypothetical protein VEX13_05920 [Chloroflexia bacterium]|nr:hypothetical protein [Chloroflexia bacterium]
MAQKLHRDYQFDYNNLQVLLGGWTDWKNRNAQDPNGYPMEGPGVQQPAPGGNINPADTVTMTVVLGPELAPPPVANTPAP